MAGGRATYPRLEDTDMRKLIAVVAFGVLAGLVLAETDYQVGQGVEKVVTRKLYVRGHNAEAVISGGNLTISNGNLYVDGTLVADNMVVTTMTNGDVVVTGTMTVAGKTTCNGELEANGIVDVNFTTTNHLLTIDQTNTVGKSGVPLCKITDARTGANANETNEAALVVSAAGTYALFVAKGASYFEGAVTSEGRISSQSGSSGEIRLGYDDSYGWLFSTIGGGQTLQFMADYAATGGVAKATLTDAGVFTATTLQGNLASTYVQGGVVASMPVTVTATSTTNVTITAQAKDLAGASVAKSAAFRFWFSTEAVQTVASTNDVQSFSLVKGDMRLYEGASGAPTYVAQTDNTGAFELSGVTVATWATTNRFHLAGPNGYYTNSLVVW